MFAVQEIELRRFDIIFKAAVIIGTIILFAVLYIFNPLEVGIASCSFRELTGYSCPTCGLTRSFQSLLHLQLVQSVVYHPMGIILFGGIMLTTIKFAFELSSKKTVLINRNIPFIKILFMVLGGLWLLFWIARFITE